VTEKLIADDVDQFVEVAVPAPLRSLFTYRVPAELAGRVGPGCRVAVPFGRRKVPAIVVRTRPDAPAGVKRILKVAGLLEREPIFPAELLSFLLRAASYYMHPIGEVLRAAAPALPRNAMKELRATGFLADDEAFKGVKVGKKLELFARLNEGAPPPVRLGKNQETVLERLRERGELSASALKLEIAGARAVLRRLADLGQVTLEEREVFTDPFFGQDVERDAPPEPHAAQATAIATIIAALGIGAPASFLIHGVTSSGKTEVYLRVIGEALDSGKTGLVLVPEIALTPQLVGRFRARFGDEIAVLHSGLKARERDAFWRRLRAGELRVAIGARSALFAPLEDLGVIIVDEEHDSSFKQEEGFRYHGRDMAMMRAHAAGAVCVLGSATPSLESFHLCSQGKVTLLCMPERATPQPLPEVELVDLRRHRQGPTGHAHLSGPLHEAIRRCLGRQEQAILFLNRRGFAPSLRCGLCGAIAQCPACSVALTEHRQQGCLRCHYCDYSRPSGGRCAECHEGRLERLGLGTEQLQDALSRAFPSARVGRLDRDTASGAKADAVLRAFRDRELDILVGTQMVTKGHDLPGVTLVGVILADQPLGFPDFRASERAFQLLAQVAGRAGRGEEVGRVLFQTYQPEHPAVRLAASHDYEGFAKVEYPAREELGYPPFGRLIAVRVDAGDEETARRAAAELGRLARAHPAARDGGVQVLGPAVAPIARLRGRFRFRLLLRGGDRRTLRAVAHQLLRRIEAGLGPARATVDVDPVAML